MPPGWQSWASPVQGNAYAQNHYRLNVDGTVDADFREDYLDSWLGQRAVDLVDGTDGFDFADGGQFIYYASYSPHTPYAYPKELEGTFADAQYPRTPDFDETDVSDKFGLTRTATRCPRPTWRPSTRRSASGSGRCRCSTRPSPTWCSRSPTRMRSTTPT